MPKGPGQGTESPSTPPSPSPSAWLPGARFGAYEVVRELIRAPGAVLLEGRDEGGDRVLLQLAPLRAAHGEAETAAREDYRHMVSRATELLGQDADPRVLDHGQRADPDGSAVLYWALPWSEPAGQLAEAPRLDGLDAMIQAACGLLERSQRRHASGRVDPLLSPQTVVVAPNGTASVIGLPIHLPPEWLADSMAPAMLAPEEGLRAEPSRGGDLWRLGTTLDHLARDVDDLPEGLRSVIDRLRAPAPKDRPASADVALMEVEALQDTVAATAEQRAAAQEPEPPASNPAPDPAADLISPDLPNLPTIGLESAPPLEDDSGSTAPEPVADDEEEEDEDIGSALDADTSPEFASHADAKPDGPPEMATVRLPFPAELERRARRELADETTAQGEEITKVPPGPVIPEGDTLLEVSRSDLAAREDRPRRAPREDRPTVAESSPMDPGEATIHDVPREQLAADEDFPTMDEVAPDKRPSPARNAKSAWDRARKDPPFDPTRNRPAAGRGPPSKTSPMGPRGTLVGARLIHDPTGLRTAAGGELPGMLPPPNLGSDADQAQDPLLPAAAPPPHADGRHQPSTQDLLPPPVGASPHPVPALLPGLQSQDLAPAAEVPPINPPHSPAPLVPQGPRPAGQALLPAVASHPPGRLVAPSRSPVPGPSGASSIPPMGTPLSTPAPKGGRRNVLLGALGFFVAGGLAAFAAPYLLPNRPAAQVLEGGQPLQESYSITPANEVLLQASPASAVVVGEDDGQPLGRTPLRFLVPPGLDTAILVTAEDHEPQRVALPVRGRIRTDLVPLTEATPCSITLQMDPPVALEAVAAKIETGTKHKIPGAALVRSRESGGAWLVRCPRLGGADPQPLAARRAVRKVELSVLGPSNATVYVDDQPVGSTPVKTMVETGFRKVTVEKLTTGADKTSRWIPIVGNTKVRMPTPRNAK